MIRSVLHCSRAEAENFPWPSIDEWACISITDPLSKPAHIHPNVMLLREEFWDLDKVSLHQNEWGGKFNRHPIDELQARAIVEFVDVVARSTFPYHILTHCEGGMSRSAAIAVWIADKYELEIDRAKASLFNRYVYNMLEREWGKMYKVQPYADAVVTVFGQNEFCETGFEQDCQDCIPDNCGTSCECVAPCEHIIAP